MNVVKIRDIAKIHYGKALKEGGREMSGSCPVYGSSGQIGWHSKSLTSTPTLIIGRKGSVGEVTFAPQGGWTIDTAFYTELVDPNRADLRYLYYVLRAAALNRHTITTSIPGINRDDIYNKIVPLPPLPEQKRIAAILDKADEISRKREKVIELTDSFLRSVFLEMFGDPVTNPKGWPTAELRDCCKLIVDCPHSTPKWTSSGKICIRTSNLTKGGWDWSDKRYISPEEFEARIKRSSVNAGDIILSREGTVGIAAIVQHGFEICMGQRLVQLRAESARIVSEFLLHILLYELAPERIERLMAGSTSRHLNVGDLRKLKIVVPPLALQTKFAKVFERIESARSLMGAFGRNSRSLFNAASGTLLSTTRRPLIEMRCSCDKVAHGVQL